ncbi:unnamed protein product [Ectocarpus sp. 12 AP-2014]
MPASGHFHFGRSSCSQCQRFIPTPRMLKGCPILLHVVKLFLLNESVCPRQELAPPVMCKAHFPPTVVAIYSNLWHWGTPEMLLVLLLAVPWLVWLWGGVVAKPFIARSSKQQVHAFVFGTLGLAVDQIP